MMVLSILSFWIGAMLAQRFRVFVLIPASAILATLALITRMKLANTSWSIALLVAATIVSMQVGYFVGLRIQNWIPVRRFRFASRLSPFFHSPSARNPLR